VAEQPTEKPAGGATGTNRVVARVRRWAGQFKASPGRLEWLTDNQQAVNTTLRSTAADVAALEARLMAIEVRSVSLSDEGRAGVTALGAEIHRLRADLDQDLAALDRALAGHAQTLQRSVTTPARQSESARLVAALGPSPETKAGLSVLTICWNHGSVLATAVTSGLALLDGLPADQQGELLILDDGSVDETARVAAHLQAADPRVRVVTAQVNLGPARARNVLLHTVRTGHAFVLDADNTASPAGVAALLAVAVEYGAAFTYGNVLKRNAAGDPAGVMSNEPLAEPWFRSNYIDTMAVVDVDVLRMLGGWLEDPAVEHVDDWALVHRLVRARELIGYVPVVVGRYTELPQPFHLSVPELRIGPDRVSRMFNSDGRLDAAGVVAFAAHPQLGPLWASPTAVARRPELAPRGPGVHEVASRPRLLVIGPGGVANLGDDAIVAAALGQVRRLAPGYDIDVVTDGPEPQGLGPDAIWMGPLIEAVRGLHRDDLAAGLTTEVAEAATITGVGSQRYRPVEPDGYVGALFLGGGSVTSLWADTLIAPRLVLAAALTEAGVAYVASGQGIGPLDDGARALADALFGGALHTSVRDAGSAVILDPAPGHDRAGAELTGDDALLLAGADRAVVAPALALAGVDEPYLAITVREADYVGTSAVDLEVWAQSVDRVAVARGFTVLGVVVNEHPAHPEVVTLSRLAAGADPRRARWRVLECRGDPTLLAGVMAGAEAAVVHSYHAALFALRAAVPTLLVTSSEYYQDKAQGLADLAGLPDAFFLRPSQPDDLSAQLDLVAKALASGAGLDPATAAVERWWSATMAELIR